MQVAVSYEGGLIADASADLVEQVRAVPVPSDAEALVGGAAAEHVDLVASIGDRLPWAAGTVVLVTLVLLFLAFGSVVLPLKAVAMNILSLSAVLGVLVRGFQDGNLAGLLGFTSTGALEVTQPILVLAIAFGLSTDYEVFLLSRIREDWERHGDNTLAVRNGLAPTGGIITSAALLLAVVMACSARSASSKPSASAAHRAAARRRHRPGAAGPGDDAAARASQLVVSASAGPMVAAARAARARAACPGGHTVARARAGRRTAPGQRDRSGRRWVGLSADLTGADPATAPASLESSRTLLQVQPESRGGQRNSTVAHQGLAGEAWNDVRRALASDSPLTCQLRGEKSVGGAVEPQVQEILRALATVIAERTVWQRGLTVLKSHPVGRCKGGDSHVLFGGHRDVTGELPAPLVS